MIAMNAAGRIEMLSVDAARIGPRSGGEQVLSVRLLPLYAPRFQDHDRRVTFADIAFAGGTAASPPPVFRV
jgi:hypothetical protein